MPQHLVVIRPFLKFVKAAVIADSVSIGGILTAAYNSFVNKVAPPGASKG
jgi:hypothetical protein